MFLFIQECWCYWVFNLYTILILVILVSSLQKLRNCSCTTSCLQQCVTTSPVCFIRSTIKASITLDCHIYLMVFIIMICCSLNNWKYSICSMSLTSKSSLDNHILIPQIFLIFCLLLYLQQYKRKSLIPLSWKAMCARNKICLKIFLISKTKTCTCQKKFVQKTGSSQTPFAQKQLVALKFTFCTLQSDIKNFNVLFVNSSLSNHNKFGAEIGKVTTNVKGIWLWLIELTFKQSKVLRLQSLRPLVDGSVFVLSCICLPHIHPQRWYMLEVLDCLGHLVYMLLNGAAQAHLQICWSLSCWEDEVDVVLIWFPTYYTLIV